MKAAKFSPMKAGILSLSISLALAVTAQAANVATTNLPAATSIAPGDKLLANVADVTKQVAVSNLFAGDYSLGILPVHTTNYFTNVLVLHDQNLVLVNDGTNVWAVRTNGVGRVLVSDLAVGNTGNNFTIGSLKGTTLAIGNAYNQLVANDSSGTSIGYLNSVGIHCNIVPQESNCLLGSDTHPWPLTAQSSRFIQQASAALAADIGGTVGSVTNSMIRNVNGATVLYWSDGTTLYSKQLAP
jgi:hypothetical protein